MANAMVKLKGVNRRHPNALVNFEMRCGGGKLYSTEIKSKEEGGLCYDLVQRYREKLETLRGKRRKAATKFNYPQYSPSLPLEALPADFDILVKNGEAMEFILKQAQAAAKNLPESLKNSASVSGCQSPSNWHQRVHGNPPHVAEVKQELPGVCTKNEFQKGFQAEQGYKSEESKCWEPRKKLEDHDLESISGSLLSDGNQMTGRQRVNEKERFPQLLEGENLADEYSIDWNSPFFILYGPEFRLPSLVNSSIWS